MHRASVKAVRLSIAPRPSEKSTLATFSSCPVCIVLSLLLPACRRRKAGLFHAKGHGLSSRPASMHAYQRYHSLCVLVCLYAWSIQQLKDASSGLSAKSAACMPLCLAANSNFCPVTWDTHEPSALCYNVNYVTLKTEHIPKVSMLAYIY